MKPFLLVAGDVVKTGGMDRANYALAEFLVRQGAEVHLVSHRVDPELRSHVVWHPVRRVAKSNFLSEFLLDRAGQSWARPITQRGGRVIVNGGNCDWGDVNWVHYVHAAYRSESQVNLQQQLKLAVTHPYYCYTEKRSLQQAQIVIANSEQTRSRLIEHQLADASKIRTVYCGIDPDQFYPATTTEVRSLRQRLGFPLDRSIVVFVGGLSDRRKGFDRVFEAWQQLCQDPTWTAQLIVVGQGAEVPIWKQKLIEAGIIDRVQFLGFRSDVPDILRAADCLVAPTRYEAYGLGVHEALCCGIPAIVTATAGVAERYPRSLSSLLLSDGSDLRNVLYHWRSQQQFYQQLVQTQVAPVLRNGTWERMAQEILSAIVPDAKPVLI